jgi:uncharacterized protein
MSFTMYEASIPHFIRMLGNLALILDKDKAHAENHDIDESVLINARLAPDMYPLSQQLIIVAAMARTCAAHLAGIENPQFENNEVTIAGLKSRVALTIAFLQGIDPGQVDNSYNLPVIFQLTEKEVVYLGQTYLLEVIIPHFYFHVTTAYAILRHHGVALGKKDYIDNE